MTQRHKVFNSKPKVRTPVTFELDGESFTAVPQIPGAQLLDFIADADSGDGARAAGALVDFLTSVIVADDRQRFLDMIHDPDKVIEIMTLGEICEWMIGEYAGRPTEPSTASSTRRSRTGTGSTAASS